MKSIFQEPSPGRAQASQPAKGSLTGNKTEQMKPSPGHRGTSVHHVPNVSER